LFRTGPTICSRWALRLCLVLLPERLEPDRVAEVLGQAGPDALVEQQKWHLSESRARIAKERKERRTEHVVSPRPPEALEVLAKDRDHTVGDELALTRVVALEDVEPDRALARRRIKQDDAIRVLGRDALEQVADEVALGIDDTDSDTGLDVL
jgi:hypothetical protein